MTRLSISIALLVLAAACADRGQPDASAELPENYAALVQAWRDKHEQDYRREHAGHVELPRGTS